MIRPTVRAASKCLMTALVIPALLSACAPARNSKPNAVRVSNADQDQLFQKSNISRFGLRGSMKVALTFDDGPNGSVTESILNTLRRYNAKATFFMLGNNASRSPELLRIMREDGHNLANHTKSHPNLAEYTYAADPQKVVNQILSTHDILDEYRSEGQRLYFRAPYGSWKAQHASTLNKYPQLADYVGPIFWNIGGEVAYQNGTLVRAADWACWSKGISVANCAQGYIRETESQKGGVMLMHDVDKRTAQMVEIIVPELIERGYEFILLEDIRDLDRYQYELAEAQ